METLARKIYVYEVAEIKLSYCGKVKASQRPKVNSSRQVFEVFSKVWEEESIEFLEDFKRMLLSRVNRVLRIVNILPPVERAFIVGIS